MAATHKLEFEHFYRDTVAKSRMLPEREVMPYEQALVKALEGVPDLLVQKVRRLMRRESMLEISCAWVGMDADTDSVAAALKTVWPEAGFQTFKTAKYAVDTEDADRVALAFMAVTEEGRYLNGRIVAVL